MFRSLKWSLLFIGLAGVIAALAVLAQALWSFQALDSSATRALIAKDVVADVLPPPMYLIEARLVLSQAVEQTLTPARAQSEFNRLEGEYKARADYWRANPPFGLEAQLLGRQHVAAQKFFAVGRASVLAPLLAGDAEAARTGLAAAQAIYTEHRAGVDETVKAGNATAEASMKSFDATRERGMWSMPLTAVILVGLAYACYVASRNAIMKAIDSCVAQARKVAGGDLRRAAGTGRTDAIGQLQAALGEMASQLAGMVSEVRGGIEGIANVSAEIAQGNNDLSQRTEHQASNLQQTAASMQQIAGTVANSASNAITAKKLAQDASGVAGEAGTAVSRVSDTMSEIRRSSQKISDITGVIDHIAFQTNILALNAAVEAARAGDQGRGFAVVANEVRGLAQRSAQAAKEIKLLIENSTHTVESGANMVNDATRTMERVVTSVQQVSQLITEISTASDEQSAGLTQINQAVGEIDEGTQRNAALVEETAAAAQALREEARRLAQAVTVFQLDGQMPQLTAA